MRDGFNFVRRDFSESRINLVRERMISFTSRIECRVKERIIGMCLEEREVFYILLDCFIVRVTRVANIAVVKEFHRCLEFCVEWVFPRI